MQLRIIQLHNLFWKIDKKKVTQLVFFYFCEDKWNINKICSLQSILQRINVLGNNFK